MRAAEAIPLPLVEKLTIARSQLVDAKVALASVMSDLNALPPQLKTSVVVVLEGACLRVHDAEQAVLAADALCIAERSSAPPPPAAAPTVLRPPGWSEHAGMIAFFLMCAAAAVARWVVGG